MYCHSQPGGAYYYYCNTASHPTAAPVTTTTIYGPQMLATINTPVVDFGAHAGGGGCNPSTFGFTNPASDLDK